MTKKNCFKEGNSIEKQFEEKFNIDVEAYCFYAAAAEGLEKRTFECCTFSVIDKEISDIYWDFRVAANLLEINNISAELSEYIEAVFKETLNYIDLNVTDRDEFLTKLKTGDKILKEKIYSTLSLVHLKDKNSSKVEKDFKNKDFKRRIKR